MQIFLATFALVFLRVFQQQNVIHRKYSLAFATSYGLALGEVTLILLVVANGWSSILLIGTGGACGICSSMYFHNKLMRKKICHS